MLTDRVVWLAIAMFVAIGVLLFPAAGVDDSYITFWVAHELSQRGDILNYNGDAVEQSSSLGFVLAIAAVQWLTGVDASVVGRVLAIGFGLATILAAANASRWLGSSVGRAAAALLATCGYFVHWSFAGMECTLAALAGTLLVLSIATVLDEGANPRRLSATAALTLVYVSARPESMFILAATLGGVLTVLGLQRAINGMPADPDKALTRSLRSLFAMCLAALAILAGFRFFLFGLWFPEAVYAKSDGLAASKIVQGFRYLLEGSADSDNGQRISEFILLPFVASVSAARFIARGVASRTPSHLLPVCGLFLIANLGFVVLVGGDGMPGNRFVVPAMPTAAVLAAAFLHEWLRRNVFHLTIGLWVALQVGGAVVFAQNEPGSYPLWAAPVLAEGREPGRFNWFERANHDHRRYIPMIAALEQQIGRIAANRQPVSMLSGQSGFVMYHVVRTNPGTLRFIDRFGIVTRDFRQCSVSADASRTMWGLEIDLAHYLEHREEFQRACGIAPPDIVYDLYWERLPAELERELRAMGYQLAYVQEDELIPGANDGRAFVAIRQRSMPEQPK
jgi:hypothetical protein